MLSQCTQIIPVMELIASACDVTLPPCPLPSSPLDPPLSICYVDPPRCLNLLQCPSICYSRIALPTRSVLRVSILTTERLPAGMDILANGLFTQLEQHVAKAVVDLDLDRHRGIKIFYGREEVQLLLEEAISNSVHNGRLVKIQHRCMLAISFITGVRPSTLGPSHKDYLARSLYPKLEDFVIWQPQQGRWRVEFTRAHNLIFDVSMWCILYFLLRGAFKYQTLAELFASNDSQLLILDDMKKKPAFLASDSGGRKLLENQPIMTTNVSQQVRNTASNAGLDPSGNSAIRRDAGNDFGLKLGKDYGSILLAHYSKSTFDRFYSRGITNIPLTGIRLGEIESSNPAYVEASKKMHRFSIAAVGCLIYRRGLRLLVTGHEEKKDDIRDEVSDDHNLASIKLTEEEVQSVEREPFMVKLNNDFVDAWNDYLSCFVLPSGKTYAPLLRNTRWLVKLPIRVSPEALEAASTQLHAIAKNRIRERDNIKTRLIAQKKEAAGVKVNVSRKPKRTAERTVAEIEDKEADNLAADVAKLDVVIEAARLFELAWESFVGCYDVPRSYIPVQSNVNLIKENKLVKPKAFADEAEAEFRRRADEKTRINTVQTATLKKR
ncbi:hypothetical protein JAAARDRAFT_409352 [Jaapia argillacea MUCL 33604]|uniref:Uncharacterized protein n=1 Tax=Jaapia argillacea MUCL 33604 TaxID=933084 RepID=A0A067PGY9_9AGAM|nr:hypothetical protein JAAARDRAFT_409352 [Jaapia argillacea MUCL 33604]